MAKPVHVYRLAVEYPEGVDWRHPPDEWEPNLDDGYGEMSFHWPAARRYLTARGAETRANLLRRYGCTVTVLRSLPVEWPDA